MMLRTAYHWELFNLEALDSWWSHIGGYAYPATIPMRRNSRPQEPIDADKNISGNLPWKIAAIPTECCWPFCNEKCRRLVPPEEMALGDAFSCPESVTFLFVCQVRSWPIVGVWWILHTPYASICIIQLCFGLKANLHWLLQRHSKVRNTGSMVASKHSQWLIQSTRSRVLGGSQHLRPKHLGLLRGRRSSGSHWGAVSVSLA